MELTSFIFLILGVIGIATLAVIGVNTIDLGHETTLPPTDSPGVPTEGISGGKLVRGVACQQDSDCVYALNAYPIQRCISENCPPEDSPNQPVQGDPAYTWIDAYRDSCVNANDLQGMSVAGEPLEIDKRAATCACAPIGAGPNGEHTSLTGQKICQTNYLTP